MSVVINVREGSGAGSAPRPAGDRQQRRVFWAKFFLCFVALGSLLNGSVASLVLLPTAAFCFAPSRRWMLEQWAQLQNSARR